MIFELILGLIAAILCGMMLIIAVSLAIMMAASILCVFEAVRSVMRR